MRIAVYTGIFGRYDELLDQPVAASSGAEFICFTDDPELSSDTWDVRVVEPAFAQDSIRSARLHKILGHPSLDDFDVTVYIDASVRLRRRPEEVVAEWLPRGVDLAVASHSYRETLIDEFDEVVRLNYDDRARVNEQLLDYAEAHPDVLTARPLWTGILVRRREAGTVQHAMRVWADHVLRYSRRDQLSFPLALAEGQVKTHVIDVDNFASEVHEWPVIRERRVEIGKAPALPSGPILVELRRVRREANELRAEVERLDPGKVHDLEREIQSLQAQVRQGHAERVVLEGRVHNATRELGMVEERWRSVSSIPGAARQLRRLVISRVRRGVSRPS